MLVFINEERFLKNSRWNQFLYSIITFGEKLSLSIWNYYHPHQYHLNLLKPISSRIFFLYHIQFQVHCVYTALFLNILHFRIVSKYNPSHVILLHSIFLWTCFKIYYLNKWSSWSGAWILRRLYEHFEIFGFEFYFFSWLSDSAINIDSG